MEKVAVCMVFCVLLSFVWCEENATTSGNVVVLPSSKKFLPGWGEVFKCGFVSTCNEGFLVLKPFGGIPPGIRCFWVLAVEYATSYSINLVHAGFLENKRQEKILPTKAPTAGIAIAPLRFENEDVMTYTLDELNTPFTMEAQAVAICFYTMDTYEPGQGFILEYSTSQNWTHTLPVTRNSEHHRVTLENNIYRHPTKLEALPDKYDGRELSTILFVPHKNQVSAGKVFITFRKLSPAEDIGCTYLKIEYYALSFMEDGTPQFVSKGVVCDDTSDKRMTTSDLVFAVVVSRRVNGDPKRKFQVTYEQQEVV